MRRFTITILVGFLVMAGSASQVSAGMDLPMGKSLLSAQGGGPYLPHIAHAKYRAAVFSLEDPHSTGLGDAVALLLSRMVLFNSRVSSLGVLTFKKDLAPQEKEDLSYFDKVDLLTLREGVVLSVWGRVLPIGDKVHLDLFVQIPPKALEQYFSVKSTLPLEAGNKTLQAHLRPDRLQLLSLDLDKSAAREIASAAESLLVLREAPRANAEITGRLPEGKIFSIQSMSRGWVKVGVAGGPAGYLPNPQGFTGASGPFVKAGNFVALLMYYAANHALLKEFYSGSPETAAVTNQLSMFELVRHSSGAYLEKHLESLQPYVPAFANLLAIAKFNRALNDLFEGPGFARKRVQDSICQVARRRLSKAEADRACNQLSQALLQYPEELFKADIVEFFWQKSIKSLQTPNIYNEFVASLVWPDLDKEKVLNIANDLARASQEDPNNLDILHNLAVFFTLAGDQDRQNLAVALINQLSEKK